MLGKLLKHEFRATGRTLLPVIGAVLALCVLANISIRILNVTDSTFVTILFGLIVSFFVLSIFVAAVMTTVVMVMRFYRNLLRDEGYLMHTLPVSVHELVWSKLIASFVWFLVTGLVIWLVILLTVLIQTGTDLGEFFAGFPSWAEIREAMARAGIRSGDIWAIGLEVLAAGILGGLTACLHFYAAMSMGHMFAKDKILLSVVFFVAISFLFSILNTGYGSLVAVGGITDGDFETFTQGIRVVQSFVLRILGLQAIQAAVLYAATVLSLKKGLNLA